MRRPSPEPPPPHAGSRLSPDTLLGFRSVSLPATPRVTSLMWLRPLGRAPPGPGEAPEPWEIG